MNTNTTTPLTPGERQGGFRSTSIFGYVIAASAPLVPVGSAVRFLMLLLTTLGVGLTAANFASAADGCPNAQLRELNHSEHLPDCRAYELVTSPFKEGFDVYASSYSDVDALGYFSAGNFGEGGNGIGAGPFSGYVANRSATGWVTTSPNPGPGFAGKYDGPVGSSPDLRSSIWVLRRDDEPVDVLDYYRRTPDGVFTRIGPARNPATLTASAPGSGSATGSGPITVATTPDLGHVLFTIESRNAFPGDASGGVSSLYEYVGTGNVRPRLVGVDNNGQQISLSQTCGNGISTDGRVVFFVGPCRGGGVTEAWARIDGQVSVKMSASECTRTAGDPGGACNGIADANIEGIAKDGSRAFFTTSQQLVDADVDQANDLYACDIPAGVPAPVTEPDPWNRCDRLWQVSGSGPEASVERVVSVSADGSRVYFVAGGVLTNNLGVNDLAAVAGQPNLYVWQQNAAHPSGSTTFVGRADAAAGQATADGRYLAFATSSALITGGPGADSDGAVDAYRYDAYTKEIARLSTTSTGDGGNDPAFPVVLRRGQALTADGGTVLFETAEPLAGASGDTASDVYVWRDGQVSEVTHGGAAESAISSSGKDIFFVTARQVTAADTDTGPDIYDARINGGFDLTPSPACVDDGCRDQPSVTPGLAAAGPSGPDRGTVDVVPVFSVRAVSATQRKRLASTGRLELSVTANTPGALTANATMTVAGKIVSVGSRRRTMTAPGTVTLTLTLSKRARVQLAAKGRLTIRIVVGSSKVATERSMVLKLTKAKTKKGKKAESRPSSADRAFVDADGGRS